ncbi:MAG: hypothetical protein GQ475_01260 [Methylococcaceae bacterium]|nr:hypothetical protein [Methylococcaceae bacterium]
MNIVTNSTLGCYLNDKIIDIILTHIKSLEPYFYQLIAISIMPNHIHLLIKQNLKVVMQQIKGNLAFKINKLLSRKGHFWEMSYFDKAIRDKKLFYIVYKYIENNARKANLADKDLRFYGIYNN